MILAARPVFCPPARGIGRDCPAANLGDRGDAYPVKGYSITVNLDDELSRAAAPTVNLPDDATRLVSSCLGADRLRVAGTAESNGYNRDPRADRIRRHPAADRLGEAVLPRVGTKGVVPWAGLRPMMPRIDCGGVPCVFYNTSDGHPGWTLVEVTADMTGDVIERALCVRQHAFTAQPAPA